MNERDVRVMRKTVEMIKKEVEAAKKKGKQDKVEYWKGNIINFILGVRQFGIVVEYNPGDGVGKVGIRRLRKMDVDKLIRDYAEDILNSTEEEIKRRREIEDGKQK